MNSPAAEMSLGINNGHDQTRSYVNLQYTQDNHAVKKPSRYFVVAASSI